MATLESVALGNFALLDSCNDCSRPAIGTDDSLLDQLVVEHLGEDDSPEEPVDGTGSKEGNTNDAVQPVREILVDRLVGIGGQEGSNHKVHGCQHEKDGDRDGSLDGGVEVGENGGREVGVSGMSPLIKVNPQKSHGHSHVDGGKRVGNQVGDEVVSISGGRGQHDHDGDTVMLKETSHGGVEGLVGGEDVGKRENTLSSELLDNPTLRENDRKNVTKSRESNKDRHGLLGALVESNSEEGGSQNSARLSNLLSGNNSKVGNVTEHVEDSDHDQGQRTSNLQGSNGVLGLGKSVVGVGVTNKGPNDVVESHDDSVSGSLLGAREGVSEVGVGVLDVLESSAKSNPSDNGDDSNHKELENTEEVLQSETPLDGERVDKEAESKTSETNTSLVPSGNFNTRGIENVLSENDRVGGSPTEEEDVGCKHGGNEELGLSVDVLEVVLLSTVLGDGCSPFEVDHETSTGNESSHDPHDQGKTNRAREEVDGGRSGKNTGSDHSVENKKDGRHDTDLLSVVGGLVNDFSIAQVEDGGIGAVRVAGLENPRCGTEVVC